MEFRWIPVAVFGVIAVGPVWAEEALKAPESIADSTPRLAAGLMMQQGSKLVMAPCRDRSYAFVEDVSEGQQVLESLNRVGLGQGKRLYVELVGVLEGGAVRASDINLARESGRCQPLGGGEENWRAAGQGWSAVVSGTHLRLIRNGQEDVLRPAKTVSDDKRVRIETDAAGSRVLLQLNHQRCYDAAENAVFGWTAQVSVDGKLLQGCGWQR